MLPKIFMLCLLWLTTDFAAVAAKRVNFPLASDGKIVCQVVDKTNDPTGGYAVSELKAYISKIVGADFNSSNRSATTRIVLRYDEKLDSEEWQIAAGRRSITLSGGDKRGLLYATYTFLEQLGCRWLAPDYEFYPEGAHEFVPSLPTLNYCASATICGRPELRYRKLYVEEGHSHTAENTAELIEWMAKLQYNVLVYPIDYQGKGRVRWDAVRQELIPQLRLRDILIEVGGHGYQNFINANMEDGSLFENNPEWFALHEGERSREQKRVFCTSSEEATNYMTNNLLAYLEAHPEIDIFDFWPPDGARWCECDKCTSIGNDSDKHAELVGRVSQSIAKVRPELIIECLGYSHYKNPSYRYELDKNVLLDFCPINQSFEGPIYEEYGSNPTYRKALAEWKECFDGEISIYSYYRKYAWHSLPILLPRYMQDDLKWYKEQGVKGISIYCEPGDWATYEVNLYMLGKLAQNVDADVEVLLEEFAKGRYGSAWAEGLAAINLLEQVARTGCSIPGTKLKSADWYDSAMGRVRECMSDIESAKIRVGAPEQGGDVVAAASIEALDDMLLMLEFVRRDFVIQHRYACGASVEERREMADGLVGWLRENLDEGVFLDGKAKPALFYKQYNARK